jgi:hypothetical protein
VPGRALHPEAAAVPVDGARGDRKAKPQTRAWRATRSW